MKEVPILSKEDMEHFQILRKHKIPTLKKLLSEEILFNVGLSPANLKGIKVSISITFILILTFDLFYFDVDMRPEDLKKLRRELAKKRKGSSIFGSQKRQDCQGHIEIAFQNSFSSNRYYSCFSGSH